MANALYDFGRESFAKADVDWLVDSIKIIFIDEDDDAPNLETDDYLDDILAGARVATSDALQTPSAAAGVCDADDITVPTVSGDQFESLTIFKSTGVEGTSILIANIDTATGLPCTPNGGDITVSFDDGANKIFKL